MNRRKLIELLNLYIDEEIGAADLARLERTVSDDPEARRLYHQYCRLDEATRMISEDFARPSSETAGSGSGGWGGRWRRFTAVAGGVAASIALISGSLIVFGPDSPESQLETIAVTPRKAAQPASYVASIEPIQSFSADTSTFTLEPASDGTLLPAAWQANFELPETVALPGESIEGWVTPAGIRLSNRSSLGLPNLPDARVYRGTERRDGTTAQTVSFQFQK